MALRKKLAQARHDEQGMALISVTILSMVIFVTVMTLMTSALITLNTTSDSKSGLKAFHAAEGGRDQLLVGLTKGECSPSGTVAGTTSTPAYSYRIYRYTSLNNEVPTRPTQVGVLPGCPLPTSTHVLIETLGRDKTSEKTIVSTYKWNAGTTTAVTVTPAGALVTGGRLVMSNFRIVTESGSSTPADVIVSNGNFKCEGSGISVQGSVYVQNGHVEDMQGCDGILNLSASGNVTVNKWSGVAVSGNLCARGSIFQLWVLSTIQGLIRQNQASCPGIGGTTQGWVDYSPNLTNAIKVSSHEVCTNMNNVGQPPVYYPEGALARLIKQQTAPAIIDLTACGSGVLMNNTNGDLGIRTDVTLVVKRGTFENFRITSADGQPHNFNIVSPDDVKSLVNGVLAPHCTSGGGELKVMQLRQGAGIRGLIYSPCTTSQVGGLEWTGQIFMGNIQSNIANGRLVYSQIIAPGWGSSSSETSTNTNAYASMTLLSQVEP